MAFHVGQKVQCTDAHDTHVDGIRELSEGAVYTIRWQGFHVHDFYGSAYRVRLFEVVRDQEPNFGVLEEIPFAARRFRPLVETKTDISVFTSLLTPNPVPERV